MRNLHRCVNEKCGQMIEWAKFCPVCNYIQVEVKDCCAEYATAEAFIYCPMCSMRLREAREVLEIRRKWKWPSAPKML